MRYWFESTEEQRDVGAQIARWQTEGKIKMVEKGDPHEQIKEKLHKINGALETLRQFGINNQVMQVYIKATTKLSNKDVDAVLWAQNDFFKKMGLSK